MNETLRALLGALTLGISEAIMAIVKATKCPKAYIYTPTKNKCCKFRKKCGLWNHCLENSDSCRQAHLNHDDEFEC